MTEKSLKVACERVEELVVSDRVDCRLSDDHRVDEDNEEDKDVKVYFIVLSLSLLLTHFSLVHFCKF